MAVHPSTGFPDIDHVQPFFCVGTAFLHFQHSVSISLLVPVILFPFSHTACGQADEKLNIVGLVFCLVRGAVALNFAATGAFVYDDVALFCVRLDLYRLHKSVALAGTVSGIFVDVQRPKAEGAVVA